MNNQAAFKCQTFKILKLVFQSHTNDNNKPGM